MTYESNIPVVVYSATNESIEAVMHGLDVNENDVILSICGSGDIPFALIEKAKKVIAVDGNPGQLALTLQRIKSLQKNNYELFFEPKCIDTNIDKDFSLTTARNNYFQNKLEKIKDNLENLELLCVDDFFEACEKENKFSKAYLSNVDGSFSDFNKLKDALPIGGLFYKIARIWHQYNFSQDIPGLELETKLTNKARKFKHPGTWKDYWRSMVFKKVE